MYKTLRNFRKKLNIPAVILQKSLGLATPAAYYKKEAGAVKFTLEEAKKISDVMNKPIEDIFFTS